jgi:hypothetical protein
MSPNLALEAALALSRAPGMVRLLRRQPLPTGITLLLQMLAGDAYALDEATRMTGLDENEVTAVVELYVLRVMLFRGASPRRVLGVENGAERGQIRRHMGYLMGWLHPDKSGNTWRVAFLRRVVEAWRQADIRAEAYEPLPPSFSQRGQNRKPLFVLPWISQPPEQRLWYRILDWKRRMRPWRSV